MKLHLFMSTSTLFASIKNWDFEKWVSISAEKVSSLKYPVSTFERITMLFTFKLSEDWLSLAWTRAHLDCCLQTNEWLSAAPSTLSQSNELHQPKSFCYLFIWTHISPPHNLNCALPPLFFQFRTIGRFQEPFWVLSDILIQSCKHIYTNWCLSGTHASLPYSITLCSSCVMNLDFFMSRPCWRLVWNGHQRFEKLLLTKDIKSSEIVVCIFNLLMTFCLLPLAVPRV